jgi:serine/threonine protein kinase
MDLGAQREISILRLLRNENSHPNIIQMHDFKQHDGLLEGQDTGNGCGHGHDLMSNVGLIMPLYSHGNLTDAIDSNILGRNKCQKVKIAHGILSAVAFLHCNGIIHRDIKGENIMMEYDDSSGDGDPFPILIDFSLAKIIEPQVFMQNNSQSTAIISNGSSNVPKKGLSSDKKNMGVGMGMSVLCREDTHTPSVGTPTYKAPEVVAEQPYHLPSDMYSVGVVLLELLRGKTLEAMKDKGGAKLVAELIDQLPDQPFANLIKGLLEVDPKKRLTASEALQNPVFKKFGIETKDELTFKRIDIKKALPFDDDNDDDKEEENNPSNCNKKGLHQKSLDNKVPIKRLKLIRRIIHELESENPMTIQAAITFAQQLSQLEDCDDLNESQALCDCVVLAHKFFEAEIWSLQQIEQLDRGIFKEFEWSAETYVDNEETLFLLMDFCLYPREILYLMI